MAERIQRIREWFKNRIESMGRRTKILWILGAVLFLVVVTFSILALTKVDYVVFNRDLSPEQSGKITAKLNELGIKNKTANSATVVLVDENQVDKARMELALAGFSGQQALTYDDILDKIDFTMSADTKNKLFLQAQQGSIANSLMTVEGVKKAEVFINVRESSTFLNLEDDVATASVKLVLESGKKLSPDQVSGLVSFVATAVKGLDENNITIIDQNGIKLNGSTGSDEEFATRTQDDLKLSVETRLDNSLTEFLNNIYGEGNVEVKSSVKLDFDAYVREKEEFSVPVEGATEGLVRSVNELKENVVNPSFGGAAGTDSNTTEIPEFPTSDEEKSAYNKSQKTLNYELNRMVEKLEKAKGQIQDISVAIIINKKSLVDENLSEDDSKKIVELVKAAAGFDETRNVQVMAKDFFEEAVVPLESPGMTVLGVPVIAFAAVVGAVLVLGIIAFIILRRRKKEVEEIVEEIELEQQEIEEIQTELEDKSSPKYQIEKFIDARPEIVAQLFRTWMDED